MNSASAWRADSSAWLGLAVLALPCVVYAMDLTVLNLALPALSADLRPSSTQLLWIVDIYGFMVAGALITMGGLGDRIGGRRLLMAGAAAFAGASVLAAFSTSAEMLIVARIVLGFAGATLAPSTLSLIRALFPDPRRRTVAIGVWVTSYSVGAAIGPLVGGALLEFFWWGSVMLTGVPVMVLLLVFGPRLLPEQRDPAAGRLDLISAGLSMVAVLSAVYGLKQAAASGLSAEAAASIGVGVVVGRVFLRRQRRLADPLIDLRLFRAPAFSGALGANLVAFFVVFGMSLFLAQYLQLVLDLSPLVAGLWSVPSALGFIAGSTLAPRLTARWSGPTLVGAGLTVGAAGYLLVAFTGTGLTPLVVGSTIGALGIAVVITIITDIAVGAADPGRAGAASATAETSSELGGALGIAVLGSIGTAIYRSAVEDGLPALPGAAPDTIGGALEVSRQLPQPARDQLVTNARDAFSQAVNVTALVSAAALLTAAILVVALLRRAHRVDAATGLDQAPARAAVTSGRKRAIVPAPSIDRTPESERAATRTAHSRPAPTPSTTKPERPPRLAPSATVGTSSAT